MIYEDSVLLPDSDEQIKHQQGVHSSGSQVWKTNGRASEARPKQYLDHTKTMGICTKPAFPVYPVAKVR